MGHWTEWLFLIIALIPIFGFIIALPLGFALEAHFSRKESKEHDNA